MAGKLRQMESGSVQPLCLMSVRHAGADTYTTIELAQVQKYWHERAHTHSLTLIHSREKERERETYVFFG
jgi:hypothetical protein